MNHQSELLPIEHRSLQPKRLKNFGRVNAEAIYATEWRRVNKQIRNLLGHILAPDDGPRDIVTKQIFPVYVTRRDAAVAASIVQWLATNVGRGFVESCEKRWREACAKQLEIGVTRSRQRGRTDTRTPLQRRKALLDAVKTRIAQSVGDNK